ncbi:hypothetical protein L596_003756 [Steinernema carpocapsae]|uniref:MAM domain-containing protein n=1 Tax=Steinernema carpocapsae TaxID=34508 RepID=A0A4U8UV86_STECR|nr:hypothetical protein L596_003756 [Steinernema carpocapsae]
MRFRASSVFLCLLLAFIPLGKCCFSQGCGQPNGFCPAYAEVAAPYSAYPYSVYQTDNSLNAFLGSRVTAKAYSSGGKGAFISKDLDLLCQDLRSCQWQNDESDELDWVHGEGNVDVEKLRMITGSNVMPGRDFFILASDPRSAQGSGLLVSDPISCQKEMGVLTLQMWRSRARIPGQEPDLDICVRKMDLSELRYCQTVQPDASNLIRAEIPPTEQPFFIVIKGYGFENSPEGGLIIIDHISYAASVENIANCEGDVEAIAPLSSVSHDNQLVDDYSATIPKVLRPEKEILLVDRDSQIEKSALEAVRRAEQKRAEVPSNQLLKADQHSLTYESCLLVKCTKGMLSASNFCGYNPRGHGASGAGLQGWQSVNVSTNVANRLTGVHDMPSAGGPIPLKLNECRQHISEQNILVATFPSRSQSPYRASRFVLESPFLEFPPNDPLYLGFRKYIAVHGVELLLCGDADANDCFYHYPPYGQTSFLLMKRSWHWEKVQLPSHLNKLFIIAQNGRKDKRNAGQLGIADIQLLRDNNTVLC